MCLGRHCYHPLMVQTASDGVVEELLGDLDELRQVMDTLGPTPFVIRSYVRTLFSILDAWSFHIKQKAYARGVARGVAFSKKDLETIFERRLTSSTQPLPDDKPKTIPTGDSVVYAIALWRYIHGGEAPPLEGKLPSEFDRLRKVRNRITHPKVKSDLQMTATDAKDAGQVLFWLKDQMTWQSRLELAYIDGVAADDAASLEAQRQDIIALGGQPGAFKGTLAELYTAPKLKPK